MRVVKVILFNIAAALFLIMLFEGAASVALFSYDALRQGFQAEHRHTKFDAELGWVGTPNVSIPDMYGPGKAFTTDANGARSTLEHQAQIPAGKARVICSGDSFTLGYGVGDGETWCDLLTGTSPALESVNLGQGGYGFDQSYLWVKRVSSRLDFTYHIAAFIGADFERLMADNFLGYPKPSFALKEGELSLANTPLREPSLLARALSRYSSSIASLRLVQAVRRLGFKRTQPKFGADAEVLVNHIIDALEELNAGKHSKLYFVLLPTQDDCSEPLPANTRRWLGFFSELAMQGKINFIELISACHALPASQQSELFIPRGALNYLGAEGHYSIKGNLFVAERIKAVIPTFEIPAR